jgi:hypothetical protein
MNLNEKKSRSLVKWIALSLPAIYLNWRIGSQLTGANILIFVLALISSVLVGGAWIHEVLDNRRQKNEPSE